MDHIATTPFGRRPLSLAMMAAQAVAKACPDDTAAHKWRVFRNLTEAKDRFGLSDRALAVLSALLTFHPETALTPGQDLIVFPSNRELALRAHGPAPATLRRALAQLVEGGVIIRRDSPNGKRFARRGEGGQVEQAYGFDLTPLVGRAAEFEQVAGEVRAEAKARHLLREEISLHRRDIAKTIAAAIEEDLPGPWRELTDRFIALGGMPPRAAEHAVLEGLVGELRSLRLDIDKCLAESMKRENMIGNESQAETHHQNSKAEPIIEFELDLRKGHGRSEMPKPEVSRPPQRAFPLGLVLKACPDIVMYAKGGVSNWNDLISVAGLVRRMLGVSPSAWEEACGVMGEEGASILIAAILQRGTAINSAGAYLRSLTERAKAGQFSLGPVLMALLRTKPGDNDARQRA